MRVHGVHELQPVLNVVDRSVACRLRACVSFRCVLLRRCAALRWCVVLLVCCPVGVVRWWYGALVRCRVALRCAAYIARRRPTSCSQMTLKHRENHQYHATGPPVARVDGTPDSVTTSSVRMQWSQRACEFACEQIDVQSAARVPHQQRRTRQQWHSTGATAASKQPNSTPHTSFDTSSSTLG
jgi:hypothetical protein